MEVFGIFEGGGAKGLAHVGALKAAETRRVQYVGVAGASAGAIVAALIAAGFSADELFKVGEGDGKASGVLAIPFRKFFDCQSWKAWKRLTQDVSNLCAKSLARNVLSAPRILWRNWSTIGRLRKKNGLMDCHGFEEYLEGLLREKLGLDHGDPVFFEDIPIPLKIIATNIDKKTIKIFSKGDTPQIRVAEAVRASISIPYFFFPKKLSGETYVDGGLLSNFPAWLFDVERRDKGPHIPTLGFRLVETSKPDGESPCMAGFNGKLLRTVWSGDSQLETREVENLHIIPLRVSAETLEFEMTNQEMAQLYDEGKGAASSFFLEQIGPKDPEEVGLALSFSISRMREVLRMPNVHLRANVLMQTGRGTLRVMYAVGMDEDPDDQLEFKAGSGACGICWRDRRAVVCDLADAKASFQTAWKMNKYQQALVRQSLQSLLCIPITCPECGYGDPLVGVLSFDSDVDLTEAFGTHEVERVALECAALLAVQLKGS